MNKIIGNYPDSAGHFGPYGGRYVGETLVATLDELTKAYDDAKRDPAFIREFKSMLEHYAARPTPVDHIQRLSAHIGGAQIYLKREDCAHTGAHKINNVVGQGLLAKRMGKKKLIAETGAGQHGVATATIAARFGMECKVFMGKEDVAAVYQAAPQATLIASHMEAVNHAVLSRQELRTYLTDRGMTDRVRVPEDGEALSL